jgi:hypothetical protein
MKKKLLRLLRQSGVTSHEAEIKKIIKNVHLNDKGTAIKYHLIISRPNLTYSPHLRIECEDLEYIAQKKCIVMDDTPVSFQTCVGAVLRIFYMEDCMIGWECIGDSDRKRSMSALEANILTQYVR